MVARGKVWSLYAALLLAHAGCGESKQEGDAPGAGNGGASGSGGRVTTGGNGGTSGSGTKGGNGGKGDAGGSAGGSAGSGGSAGVGGTAGKGGTAGTSASGGTSGSAGARWDSACNGVSTNGRCNGAVFEWCDYYTKGLRTFDCASLGMTCQADERQPPEGEVNGCVGDPCPMTGEITCDGRFIRDCAKGLTHVTDCEKTSGVGATCLDVEGSHVCIGGVSCGIPSSQSCDGTILATCNEYGQLRALDCARCNPVGLCGGGNGCTPSIYDCDLP